MNTHDDDRMKQLLRQAVPPVEAGAEPARDLWPAVLRRLDADNAGEVRAQTRWVWFDVALLAGLAVLGVSFPATIPLLLYYL
jgi:hypothetical protein